MSRNIGGTRAEQKDINKVTKDKSGPGTQKVMVRGKKTTDGKSR